MTFFQLLSYGPLTGLVREVRSEGREIEREETLVLTELRELAGRMYQLERTIDEHIQSEGPTADPDR
ncbi:MAG TPA: hypothetical protein VJ301_07350 [Propionibacteriaceae bacterium]|nr:hypothetical protein [Propionibacteriaceae bacterium]